MAEPDGPVADEDEGEAELVNGEMEEVGVVIKVGSEVEKPAAEEEEEAEEEEATELRDSWLERWEGDMATAY